ncbi:MAG: hypothetical protein ABSG83_18130 [Roseiarcus sp.]
MTANGDRGARKPDTPWIFRTYAGHSSAVESNALFRANLEACWYFWIFIGLVELFFWLLFYVI